MAKKTKQDALELCNLVVEAILDRKGLDVVSLDLRHIPDTVTDFFVIAHGDSNTHVNAIHQSIKDSCKEAGFKAYRSEGMKNGEWIIVDFVDVVAHIFYREKREFYQLEDLWSDAKITKHGEEETIKGNLIRPIKKSVATKKTIAPIEDDFEEYEEEEMLEKVARKTVKKKAPAKKTAAKKVAAKKAPARKVLVKEGSNKSITKKSVAKKAAPKKEVAKKATPKKK